MTSDRWLGLGLLGAALLWLLGRRERPLIPSVTTSETFELPATEYPAGLHRFANAIANAEGFFASDTVPVRANNPGDLKLGPPTLGSTGITVFDSAAAGWAALKRQLGLIVTGSSKVYHLDMSIADMAASWTATEQSAWASNVARYLGVTTDTRLVDLLLAA